MNFYTRSLPKLLYNFFENPFVVSVLRRVRRSFSEVGSFSVVERIESMNTNFSSFDTPVFTCGSVGHSGRTEQLKFNWFQKKSTYFKLLIVLLFISSSHLSSQDIENERFYKMAHEKLKSLYASASKKNLNDIQFFNENERLEWVKEKSKELKNGAKILDVGAGSSPYKDFFKHCTYKTHDFKKNDPHVKYENIDYISDITQIPVEDESFDAVICTEVFEHVPEPILALKEIARILKPDGKLFLSAPLSSGLHQMPYHYYGGFTPEWYKLFGPKFNLKIVKILPNGGFFKMLTQECSRFAWTFRHHEKLHGENKEFIYWLFNQFLPKYLYGLDEKCFIDGFTIGYHVEAIKMNSSNKQESTFNELWEAAVEKNANKIKDLNLKNRSQLIIPVIDYKNNEGLNSLMIASIDNLTDIAKFLIENGANVNAIDKNGTTPLMFACWKGNYETAKLLIEHKANKEALDINGTTALHLADKLTSPNKNAIINLLIDDYLKAS